MFKPFGILYTHTQLRQAKISIYNDNGMLYIVCILHNIFGALNYICDDEIRVFLYVRISDCVKRENVE